MITKRVMEMMAVNMVILLATHGSRMGLQNPHFSFGARQLAQFCGGVMPVGPNAEYEDGDDGQCCDYKGHDAFLSFLMIPI